MNKIRMVSGIKPTGTLTLGNYLGAIKNFVKLQEKYEMYIFVADLHALTIDISPKELRENKKNIMAIYIAAGLDPKKNIIFNQSDVNVHGESLFIFENMTTIGELSRMTQYKDKSSKFKKANGTEQIKTGLLTYPCLMAGDILLYSPNFVPVGEDQKQHIELTRNIANRFNNKYGKTLEVPEIIMSKTGSKIMSLQEPTKKMSKTDASNKSFISLLENPENAYKKIIKAKTDSENKIYISDNKPGIKNLLQIYASIKDISLKEAENKFKNYENYGIFKKEVAIEVKNLLIKLQTKYYKVIKNIDKVASEGAKKANLIASITLKSIKEKIGLL